MGITPGHVQLQLMWEKVDDTLPKREQVTGLLGPRVQINQGVQIPLMGKRSKL